MEQLGVYLNASIGILHGSTVPIHANSVGAVLIPQGKSVEKISLKRYNAVMGQPHMTL